MSEQKLLLISGRKQSGKSSAMNYLAGYLLRQQGLIQQFSLDEQGQLLIDCEVQDPVTFEIKKEWGVLDITRQDQEYVQEAARKIWPVIKPYHFADMLKEIAVVVFQLNRLEVYGSDDDKNKLTKISWQAMNKLGVETPSNVKSEFLTNREFLERFGTDVCRTLYPLCWIESLFERVAIENYPFCVIADCRYEEEVEYAKNLGAKVIRLTRNPFNGKHSAETSLNNCSSFDAVIDNSNMTQEEKGQELIKILQGYGWIS